MNKNAFTVQGHLGADPEIRQLNNGGRVANLRIAQNPSSFKKDGEWVSPDANWFTVQVYIPTTITWIEKRLKTGDLVEINASLRPRTYTDADGCTRYTIDIVVRDRRDGHSVVGLHLKANEQDAGE